mgnify:CR=1 FL=1
MFFGMHSTHMSSRHLLLVAACLMSCSEAPASPPTRSVPVARGAAPRLTRRTPQPRFSPDRSARPKTPVLSTAARSLFSTALAHPDWMTRLSAIEALDPVPDNLALPWLEQRLADVEPDVRAAAVSALGRREAPRALVLLLSVQNDASEELSIRVAAASAALRTNPNTK